MKHTTLNVKNNIRKFLKKLSGNAVFRKLFRPLTKAGFITAAIYKRLPVEGEIFVPTPGNHGFVYCSSSEDAIGRALYWRGSGGLEPETLRYMTPLFKNAKIFADIGAHTGHFSLYACAVNADLKVHAFEPVVQNFLQLKQNITRNNWLSRCSLYQSAAGHINGKAPFHIPHDALPSSASFNPAGFNNIPGTVHEINVVRLDTLFTNSAPDLMKIDVEGFEYLILDGMTNIFKSGYRPHIIFECHTGEAAQKIMNILNPLGYRYAHLSRAGTISYDAITQVHGTRQWNWAAIAC